MKATIIPTLQHSNTPIAICVVIPFENIEVSISLTNGFNLKNDWLTKDEVLVFNRKTGQHITKEVLGVEIGHATNGGDLLNILYVAKKFDSEITCNDLKS